MKLDECERQDTQFWNVLHTIWNSVIVFFGNGSLCSISNELNIEPYEGFFFLSETPGAIHFISCALFLSGHGEHRSGPQTKET